MPGGSRIDRELGKCGCNLLTSDRCPAFAKAPAWRAGDPPAPRLRRGRRVDEQPAFVLEARHLGLSRLDPRLPRCRYYRVLAQFAPWGRRSRALLARTSASKPIRSLC